MSSAHSRTVESLRTRGKRYILSFAQQGASRPREGTIPPK